MRQRDEAVWPERRGRTSSPPWIGANFWSRSGGPRMWTRYDRAVVREELAVLAEHGLNVTRSFCYWPDFVPEPGRGSTRTCSTASRTSSTRTSSTGSATIPTFIVGHMSGENWDPAWRQRPRPLPRRVARRAAGVARRARSRAASATTRRSSAGSSPTRCRSTAAGRDRDEITAWARLVVQAVRAGGRHAAALARRRRLGHRDRPATTTASRSATLAPLVDFVGPHVYPMERRPGAAAPDAPRSSASSPAASASRSSSRSSASARTSPPTSNAAAYYRQVLHTTLLAGAHGLDRLEQHRLRRPRDQDPYRHHVFELHFGLTDATGRPKPQLGELARFARLVASSSAPDWEPIRGDAALLVPEHFERELPFTSPAYRQDIAGGAAAGLRRGPGGRPPDRARPRARRHPRHGAPLPRAVDEAPHRPRGLDRLRRARARRRHGVPLLLRGQHREPARAVAHRARRALRRAAPAALRPRRPDRGRDDHLRLRRAASATSSRGRG